MYAYTTRRAIDRRRHAKQTEHTNIKHTHAHIHTYTHARTYAHTHIYIYIYVRVYAH